MPHRSDTPVGIVIEELAAVGITEYEMITGKHHKVRFYISGQKYTYTVPITTSDGRRTKKNCRAGIKRLLRNAGLST